MRPSPNTNDQSVRACAALTLTALLFAACGGQPQTQTDNGTPSGRPAAALEVVVGLERIEDATRVAEVVGGQVERILPGVRAATVRLPAGMGVSKATTLLESLAGVRYSEANQRLHQKPVASGGLGTATTSSAQTTQRLNPQALNGDPDFGRQWQHRQLRSNEAWGLGFTGKGIRIGIVDDDMDRTHPDLAANIVYPGFDAVSATPITASTAYDGKSFHGTMVAGTAAAVGGNGVGGAGIAPEASIVPITHSHSDASDGSFSLADAALGILFAVNGPDGKAPGSSGDTDTPAGHKGFVDIINLSGGGPDYSQLWAETVSYALSAGIVFVASAGNTPTTALQFPAGVPGVISVAATQPNGQRAEFSNRGYHLTVAAPGENVYVTGSRLDEAGDASNSKYEYTSGTSFSSPATAAVAALILQAAASKNPDGSVKAITLTPRQVRAILESSASNASRLDEDLGYGIVNAEAAVKLASGPTAALPQPGATASLQFVQQTDPDVSIGLTGITLVGGDGVPQYAQSSLGQYGLQGEGLALFAELNPGMYALYASGPRQTFSGVPAGTVNGQLELKPGKTLGVPVPVEVSVPLDRHEPNDTSLTATTATIGDAFSGSLPKNDQDWYRLSATAGQKLWINSERLAGKPNTKLELFAANGTTKLAENLGNRKPSSTSSDVYPDAALEYTFTSNGTYLVKVSEEATSNPFNTYLIAFNLVKGNETEPNGSATVSGDLLQAIVSSGANALVFGDARDASVDPVSDVDFYSFTGTAGQDVLIDFETTVSGSLDGILNLFGPNGALVAKSDDADVFDPRLRVKLPTTGTYLIGVASLNDPPNQFPSKGPYRITLSLDQN